VFPPPLALRHLAQVLIPAAAIVATTYDYELWRRGPDLTPLHAVAPSLEVVSLLWAGLGERMAGRMEAAVERYERVELLLARPDRSGVDRSHAAHTRMGVAWGMGMIQASMGQERCLAHAEMLCRDPWYNVTGILVRMLHAYWQADPIQGDAEKERWLLSLIESKARNWFEGVHLVAELSAHALAGDLERLKSVLPDVRSLTELAHGWQPIYDYALGEYDYLRGELSGALVSFTRARQAQPSGEHQIWALAASGELRVLIQQELFADAVRAGEEYLRLAVASGLVQLAQYVRIPLARAHADCGHPARAQSLIEEAIGDLERTGVTGLLLGWAHEVRAQIALLAGDVALARQALESCSQHLRAGENPLGRRRRERLVRWLEASSRRHTDKRLALELARARAVLGACRAPLDRASAALGLLLEQTGASGGILQLTGEPGLPTAQRGLGDERELAERLLGELIQSLQDGGAPDAELATVTALEEPPRSLPGQLMPIILRHGVELPVLTGVALLRAPRDRAPVDTAPLLAALSRALLHGRRAAG
jgi:hypothetical protein